MLRRTAVARVLTLAVLVLGAVACGGGEQSDAAATSTEAATPATTATATPTASAATPSATPEVAVTEATRTSGQSGAIASPYQSFHYLVSIEMGVVDGANDALFGGRVEGDYVAPDRHAFTNQFGFAGLTFTTNSVIIGTEAWNQEGAGPWTPTTIDALFADGSIGLTSADPDFFGFDTEAADGFGGLNGEPETLNGLDTTKYVLTKELYETVAPFLADTPTGDLDISQFDDFTTTIWIDRDANALVKMELYMTAPAAAMGEDLGSLGLPLDSTLSMTMSFEMSRLNDEAIAVEPPLP